MKILAYIALAIVAFATALFIMSLTANPWIAAGSFAVIFGLIVFQMKD